MKTKITLLLLATLFVATGMQAEITCDGKLTVTEITSNSITVTWNKATSTSTPQNELKYSPYYIIGGTAVPFLTTLTDAGTYTYTELLSDTKYSLGIEVKDNSGQKGYYSVNDITTKFAIVPVTGVKFNQPPNFFTEGQAQTLDYIVSPANATNKKVTLTSSNPSVIAAISGTDLVAVVAISAGTATITITTEDGGFTDTRDVTVAIPVTGVWLNKTTLSLVRGEKETLVATVAPTDATNKTVTWSSDNPAIAHVDPGTGEIQAISAGSAVITAKTFNGDFTATCTVTITAPSKPVTGITLPTATLNMEKGDKITLTPTIAPADASIKGVSWTSSNKAVATVSASGEVVAVGGGSATIIATTNDGGFTATCEITVTGPPIGVEDAEKAGTYAAISADILYVTSPVAESISIYSITGALLYTTNKPSGEFQIPLVIAGNTILIIEGSSGWVQKVIKK